MAERTFDSKQWGGHSRRGSPLRVIGWRCATCGTELDIATPLPFRCPLATADDPGHVLQIVNSAGPSVQTGASEPFVNFDHDLAWASYAACHGIDLLGRLALVAELDDAVRRIAGVGFVTTPFARSAKLSDEVGFGPSGGVWVKDETGAVGGSQKARFLFSILLHLRAAEELGHLGHLGIRPRLAIASCGNAAVAAAILAKAAAWPLEVYVPTWMASAFGDRLEQLGAAVHRCERRAGDPPGDPAMLRFREAVTDGAVPFTVQGPENALCLDGGRTIGWEIASQVAAAGLPGLDRVFVQVGGGAFAASLSAGLGMMLPDPVPLLAVQTEGCAPLARAWHHAEGVEHVAGAWAELMTPWHEPHSIADGILDDETYDWVGVVEEMRRTGGRPIVVAEDTVVEAHDLARSAGYDVSPTGSAGLAGMLALREEFAPSERVAVVMSGVER